MSRNVQNNFHTQACSMAQLNIQQERDVWMAAWPNYCRTCEGWGGHQFRESHGSPYGSELLFDVCACVEIGKCPRCGGASLTEFGDDTVCSLCLWSFHEGMPGTDIGCICPDPIEDYDVYDAREDANRAAPPEF